LAWPLKETRTLQQRVSPRNQQYTPAADLLRKPGLNVEVAANGWGNLTIAEPRKNRSTRAAGVSSATAGSVPTCCIPASIGHWAPMVRPPGWQAKKLEALRSQ
jgi:hypothetical protein